MQNNKYSLLLIVCISLNCNIAQSKEWTDYLQSSTKIIIAAIIVGLLFLHNRERITKWLFNNPSKTNNKQKAPIPSFNNQTINFFTNTLAESNYSQKKIALLRKQYPITNPIITEQFLTNLKHTEKLDTVLINHYHDLLYNAIITVPKIANTREEWAISLTNLLTYDDNNHIIFFTNDGSEKGILSTKYRALQIIENKLSVIEYNPSKNTITPADIMIKLEH